MNRYSPSAARAVELPTQKARAGYGSTYYTDLHTRVGVPILCTRIGIRRTVSKAGRLVALGVHNPHTPLERENVRGPPMLFKFEGSARACSLSHKYCAILSIFD